MKHWGFILGSLAVAAGPAAGALVSLAASPNPAAFGSPVTMTAIVTPSSASGKVAFYDGVQILGISSLSSGKASLTTEFCATGPRTLSARYLGDSQNAPSLSPSFTESVSTLNPPTGTVVANAAIVQAGTGGSIDLYVHDVTDVIVDIDGYFAPPGTGGLSFYL